jgi:hypothetical protein
MWLECGDWISQTLSAESLPIRNLERIVQTLTAQLTELAPISWSHYVVLHERSSLRQLGGEVLDFSEGETDGLGNI